MQEATEIALAIDLDDCLQQLQAQPDMDLLLLDLNMPGMQGPASVQEVIRAHPQLPVVILSAAEDQEEVKTLLNSGVSGYIPKSSSPQVMLSAIQLILAGGIYVPPQLLRRDTLKPFPDRPGRMPDPAFTERQLNVLRLLAEGKPNKQICRELGLGEGTVKTHLAAIFRTLDVCNRTEASYAARRLGLV